MRLNPSINALQRQTRCFDSSLLTLQFAGLQLVPENAHAIELLEAACAASIATWGTQRPRPTVEDIDRVVRESAFNKGLITEVDDPHEHLFTAYFTNHAGSHIVFPGGTSGGTRPLETVSGTLENVPERFDPVFHDQVIDLINGVLKLSTHVAKRAGLEANTLPAGWHRLSRGRPSELPLITTVAGEQLQRLSGACVISTGILRQFMSEGEFNVVERWLTGTLTEIQKLLKKRPTEALKHKPLLLLDDSWVLIAPHSLLAATTRAVIHLVQEAQVTAPFDEQAALMQHVQTQFALARLGCEPLRLSEGQEQAPGVMWYSLDTDKVVSVTNLTQPSVLVDTKTHVGNWQPTLPFQPPELPDSSDVSHLLHLLVMSDLGDGFRIPLPKLWLPEQVLALRSDDLDLLASAYRGDSTVLWRLQQSRVAFRKAVKCHFDNPIDEIAFLSQWDFPRSFPFPEKSAVLINGEMGADWRRKIQVACHAHAVPWIDGMALVMVERHEHMPATLYVPLMSVWSREHVVVEQSGQIIWVLDERGQDFRDGLLNEKSHATVTAEHSVEALQRTLPDFVQAVAVWLTHLLSALPMVTSEDAQVIAIFVGVEPHQQPCRAAINREEWAIRFTLSPAFEKLLHSADNRGERELVRVLATSLTRLQEGEADPGFINQVVNEVAPLGDKRLMMRHVSAYDTQLDPRGLVPVRYARGGERHEWAVYVGKALSKEYGWKLGRSLPVQSKIAIEANTLLYGELQRRLSALDGELLLRLLLEHQEAVRFDQQQLMTSRISRELTFVESTKPFNPASEGTSVALRFLLEVVVAKLPTGSALPSLTGLDELMGLVLQMIEYGYAGDAIKYGVGQVKVALEVDGSLSMDAEDYQRTMLKLREYAYHEGAIRANQERYEQANLDNEAASIDLDALPERESLALQQLDTACQAIHNVTARQIMRFMIGALNIGDHHEGGVIIMPLEQFRKEIQADTGWTPEAVFLALDALSLRERDDFLIPPDGFLKSEVLPWQFNRALSLLKRPFILTTLHGVPHIAWGNRALESAKQYWMYDQLFAGRLHPGPRGAAGAKEAARAMGELNTRRGEAFNAQVLQVLDESGYQVQGNVKRFGKLKLIEGGETLGDIDVLAWDERRRRILVLECKAYVPARTPVELHSQLQEFLHGKLRKGKSPERPLIEKHLRRSQFVEAHLDQILAHIGIQDLQGWEVQPAYVMSNLPSELLKDHAPYPVLHLDELVTVVGK